MLVIREDLTTKNEEFKKEWDYFKERERIANKIIGLMIGMFIGNAISVIFFGCILKDFQNLQRSLFCMLLFAILIIAAVAFKSIYENCPMPCDMLILQDMLKLNPFGIRTWYDVRTKEVFLYTNYYDTKSGRLELLSVPVKISNKSSNLKEVSIAYLDVDKKTIVLDLNEESFNRFSEKVVSHCFNV